MTDYTVDDIANMTIETLISLRRDRFSLNMTTPQELDELPDDTESGHIKNHLVRWNFITFEDRQSQVKTILLIGTGDDDRMSWCTSPVTRVNLARGLVQTKSGSLYKVIGEQAERPPHEHVLHVAAAFKSWGMARALGMPVVFY